MYLVINGIDLTRRKKSDVDKEVGRGKGMNRRCGDLGRTKKRREKTYLESRHLKNKNR